jgi:serine/threonine protein kinase
MSPEHLVGPGVSHATDQYAVAAVLFELLVGAPPIRAANPYELLQRIVFEPAPTLAEHLGHPQDPALEALMARALAKHPSQRFPSAAAMADELRVVVDRIVVADENATAANPIFSDATIEVDLQAVARADAAAHRADVRRLDEENEAPTQRLERLDTKIDASPRSADTRTPVRLVSPPKPRNFAPATEPSVDVRLAIGSIAPHALMRPSAPRTHSKRGAWVAPAIALATAFATILVLGLSFANRSRPPVAVGAAAAAGESSSSALTQSSASAPSAPSDVSPSIAHSAGDAPRPSSANTTARSARFPIVRAAGAPEARGDGP